MNVRGTAMGYAMGHAMDKPDNVHGPFLHDDELAPHLLMSGYRHREGTYTSECPRLGFINS